MLAILPEASASVPSAQDCKFHAEGSNYGAIQSPSTTLDYQPIVSQLAELCNNGPKMLTFSGQWIIMQGAFGYAKNSVTLYQGSYFVVTGTPSRRRQAQPYFPLAII